MLRSCVIGLGVMGSNHVRVLHELQQDGKTELIGVADANKERAREIGRRYNVDWFTEYKRMLKEKPDFVVVAVPTRLHYKVAIDVIDEGCHILVEKPIAYTIKEGKKILDAAERSNVRLMIGHIERFNPVIQKIKERTDREKILLIGTVRVGPMPLSERVDTGVVVDLAVHDIDLIRYLTNSDFKRIIALTSNGETNMEKSAVFSFEMETGALGYMITNVITPLKVRRIEVTTPKRFIRGDFIGQKITEYSMGKLITHAERSALVRQIDIPYVEPLKLELRAFINSLEQKTKPPVSGEDGLNALETAIKCIQRSAKSQKH